MPRKSPEIPTRKQLFVDPEVQGALVAETIIYWVVCTLSIALLLLCWRVLTGPVRPIWSHLDDMWFFYGPAFVASLIVMPLAITDVIRVTNRFAGPLFRLRRSMRALAAGQRVARLQFRKDDFWYEFAEEFNAVAAELERLRGLEKRRLDTEGDREPCFAESAGSRG